MDQRGLFFCTLFDNHYAAKGLAMYYSLKQVCANFHLFVFAFDDLTVKALNYWHLPEVSIITLKEFEDKDLLRVKEGRSSGEYCWTCTPSTILYCLQHYSIDHCTYIDADLFFFSNPSVLVEEMGDNDVLITEHRYTPQYDQSIISGKYCVQFVTFKNTDNALYILKWWRNACLEWCFNRHEDGKFGDQKYLDDWPNRFHGVHVLKHLGGGIAPWNMQQYRFYKKDLSLVGENADGVRFDVVFFHFHALLCYKKRIIREFYAQEYFLPKNAREMLYSPYVRQLKKAHCFVRKEFPMIDGLATRANPIQTWWKYIKRIRRRILQKDTRYFYWIGR